VKAVGGLGAAALGAGSWAQFGRTMSMPDAEPLSYAWWILAAGGFLVGAAIWIGTSGDPAIHVGDGGIGLDKGTLRRMPWHAVSKITFEGGAGGAVVVTGEDEAGVALTVRAPVASQPQAAAWIVKEARARVPDVVDIDEERAGDLPKAHADAGEPHVLEPLQVVGKRCAVTDEIISFEPDARVCPRCERVYHKKHVPDACPCGTSLASLKKEAPSAAEG
jgi:hypothetical protein